MRLHDGRYECALCGAALDIPLIPDPQVMIKAASGEPRMRALLLDGRVVHECALDPEPHELLRASAAATRAQSAELQHRARELQGD